MTTLSPRSNAEVLVLGGGFTGVMAALEALKHTPAVTIIEKNHCLTDCDTTPAFYFHKDWDCTDELKHLGCTFNPVKDAVWKVIDKDGKEVTNVSAFMAEAIGSSEPSLAKDVAFCSLSEEDLKNPKNLQWSGTEAVMFLSPHSHAHDFVCTDAKKLKTNLLKALEPVSKREKCEVLTVDGKSAHTRTPKGEETITCEHIIDTRHKGPEMHLVEDLSEKSTEGMIEYHLHEKDGTLVILSPFGKVSYSRKDIANTATHRGHSKNVSTKERGSSHCEEKLKRCVHSIEESLHHAVETVKHDLHL